MRASTAPPGRRASDVFEKDNRLVSMPLPAQAAPAARRIEIQEAPKAVKSAA
jgi:hypothetical protein